MMRFSSRCCTLLAVGAMAALSAVVPACGQDYTSRPIKLITPYPAGGQADIVARLIGQQMTEILGQSVVIENKPGGGGSIAVDALMLSAPDGYTLLIADAGQWAINPALRKQSYDARRDLAPVGKVSTSSLFLVAHKSVGVSNLQELIALARAKPATLTYGSSGTGTVHHLSMEAFKAALGLDITHIPFKGTAQSVPAAGSGQTSLAVAGLNAVAPFVQTGDLKILGANTKKRSRLAPDVPSMAEAGAGDFDFPGELGLFAPVGTPQPIVDKLSGAVAKGLENAELQTRFAAAGVEADYGTPDQLRDVVRIDIDKYARAVQISGAKPE